MKKRHNLHRLVCITSLGAIFIVHAVDQAVPESRETAITIRKKEQNRVPRKDAERVKQAEQLWQKTEAYRDGFKSFVESKISMGHRIVNNAPRWVTSVVNTGLELVGSEYRLDEKELKGLDRYFANPEKKDDYLSNVKIDLMLLKEIFDEFTKVDGQKVKADDRKFADLKPILEAKARANLPGIDEVETRMQLNEDRYFKVLTTTMFATYLYDQRFVV